MQQRTVNVEILKRLNAIRKKQENTVELLKCLEENIDKRIKRIDGAGERLFGMSSKTNA